MAKKRIIPYGVWPYSWGVKGKKRDIEKAEYELDGEELDRRLAEINSENKDDLAKENLKLDRKHHHISKEKYDYLYAELKFQDDKMGQSLARLELDKKYDKISESDYEKGVASLNGEPWVGVLTSEYIPGEGTDGFSFELDWNDSFVEMLAKSGYDGETPEQIVEQWFEDKATEEYMHLLTEMAEDGIDETIPVTNVHREKTKDGKTLHS